MKKKSLLSEIRGAGGNLLKKITLKKMKLFGGSLLDGVSLSEFRIPEVVYTCAEYVKKNGTKTEGIFRVPGSNEAIQDYKKLFEKHEEHVELTDPSDAAGVLKLYLRELSTPLVPFSLYSSFLDLEDKNNKLDPDQKLIKYKELEAKIPKENIDLLAYLTQFLSTMAESSSDTKMDVANLAMVFAPNIFRPEKDTQQSLVQDYAKSIECMKAFIQNSSKIFSEISPQTDWKKKVT